MSPATPTLPFGGSHAGVPILTGWDDFGEVGQGASRAHIIGAENGSDYLAKCRSYCPGNPLVAANELIAARLAGALGLPVLDHCLLRIGGELLFGSSFMAKPTFYPQISQALFDKCENKSRIYDVVAFDAWIANVDRNDGNLIVRQARAAGGAQRHLLMLNDHSHCLLGPNVTKSDLIGRVDSPPDDYVKLPFVRTAITNANALEDAANRIANIEGGSLTYFVKTTPDELVDDVADLNAIHNYLNTRRAKLRDILLASTTVFPNLR